MFEVGTRVFIIPAGVDEDLDGRTGIVVSSWPLPSNDDECWVRLDGPGTEFWPEGEEVPFFVHEIKALEG